MYPAQLYTNPEQISLHLQTVSKGIKIYLSHFQLFKTAIAQSNFEAMVNQLWELVPLAEEILLAVSQEPCLHQLADKVRILAADTLKLLENGCEVQILNLRRLRQDVAEFAHTQDPTEAQIDKFNMAVYKLSAIVKQPGLIENFSYQIDVLENERPKKRYKQEDDTL